MQWIILRAKERSTWMGLFSVVGAIGIGVSPENKEIIISAAIAVVAAIAALTKDKAPVE
jgi:hypothetical protein